MEENKEGTAVGGDQQGESGEHKNGGAARVPNAANPQSQSQHNEQPSNRDWKSPHFWDFKFSTVGQAAVSLALVFVGIAQMCVYSKQSHTMQRQLEDIEAQQRAFLEIINPEMTPYDANGIWLKKGDPGVAGWLVSPGWKNVGLTLAQHVRMGFDLKPYPVNGRQSIEQLIAACPPGPSLTDHPEFPGFTIAPGEPNGKIAPTRDLSLPIATAAQHNQMVIIFVIDATYQNAFQDSPLRHSYACVEITVNDPEKSTFSFVNLKQEGD
jgi:hypothetical protein